MRRFGFLGSLTTTSFARNVGAIRPLHSKDRFTATEAPRNFTVPDASNVDLGRATSLARPHAGDPARGVEGLGIGRLDAPKAERPPSSTSAKTRIQSLPLREQSLMRFMLAQDELRRALTEGPGVELRATGDISAASCFLPPATFEISSREAAEARASAARAER